MSLGDSIRSGVGAGDLVEVGSALEEGEEPGFTDGDYVRTYLEQVGFADVYHMPIDDIRDKSVIDTLQTFGTAVAVSDIYRQRGVEPIEIGGWAVFAHLFSIEGGRAFDYWRGSHDSDKYFQAWDDVKDPFNQSGLQAVLQRSSNYHHTDNGDNKYTAHIEIHPGTAIEIDFMQAREKGKENYTLQESEEIPVGQTSIRVPTLQRMLTEKLSIGPEQRAKDKNDVVTLLYVAEQRHLEGDEQYSPENIGQLIADEQLYDRLEDSIQQTNPAFTQTPTPSSQYTEATLNHAV